MPSRLMPNRVASRLSGATPYVVVFVVAMTARIGSVLWRGGYGGYFNYDSGVYYASASALLHGRLPYRDFTLLHPPGSTLALTPFAALGNATTDHVGYVAGNIAFSVMGALAAVVVMLIVRQLVDGPLAMWAGGLGYACYVGAVNAEFEARLEPLANLLLLLGLLCMVKASRSSWWLAAAGGAALAASVSVKVWYVVPAAIVLAGYLAATRRHRLVAALGGLVVAVLVIDGPFFLAAPRAMFQDIVSDQLGRRGIRGDVVLRLTEVSGFRPKATPTFVSYPDNLTATVVTSIVLVLLVGLAAVSRAARLVALMLAVQVAVLLSAPTFFHFYVDYLTPAAAVCAGVSVGVVAAILRGRLSTSGSGRVRRIAPGVGLATLAAVLLVTSVNAAGSATSPYPAALFARSAAAARCITSDNPQALIQLDALSRGLGDGCPNWVDVQGQRLAGRYHLGEKYSSPEWERDFARYLLSGDAVALIAPPPAFLATRLLRILQHAQVLKSVGQLCLIRITDEQRQQLSSGVLLPPRRIACANLNG